MDRMNRHHKLFLIGGKNIRREDPSTEDDSCVHTDGNNLIRSFFHSTTESTFFITALYGTALLLLPLIMMTS